MNFSIETLLKNKPVLLDGSWGTELQKMGLNPGNCPDEWNLTNPDKVFKVAEDYVMAGSSIILTNTFRSNKIALSNFNLENSVTELNKKGVEISKEAAAGRAKVFASIGPSGKLLATGEINVNELEDIFIQQAEIIAEAGADGIVIETMSDL
ncbi:MAG TPA: homocysteine S-methyltransferase family protein, partial [Ignavibacteriaceae bacterium]|nr:homocysteine S-methyltransferase family protein [Ignavibacteriaceae bacterium]